MSSGGNLGGVGEITCFGVVAICTLASGGCAYTPQAQVAPGTEVGAPATFRTAIKNFPVKIIS